MVEVCNYLKDFQTEADISWRITEIETTVNMVCLENPLHHAVPFRKERGREKKALGDA